MCHEGQIFETRKAKLCIFSFIADLTMNHIFQATLLTRYLLVNFKIIQNFMIYIKKEQVK